MNGTRERETMSGRGLFGLIALAAIVLIAGAGFCVVDSDHAQAAGLDLCLSIFVAGTVAALPVPLVSAERTAPACIEIRRPTSLDPLAPPPKA